LTLDIRSNPRPGWSPLTREGCRGVEGNVLFGGANLVVVMLRFGSDAEIDLHAAPHHIDAVIMEGSGFVQLGQESSPIGEGQSLRWPAGVVHRLWTAGSPMTALMLEHVAAGSGLH
jgi:quercetin dioxygenase-like cupin family protein